MASPFHPVFVAVALTTAFLTSGTSSHADNELSADPASAAAESRNGRRPMRIGSRDLHPIREKMQRTLTVEALDVALPDVVHHCAAEGEFTVTLDPEALEHLERLDPISIDWEDVTIERALDRALHPYGLEWVIRRDDLRVTSLERVMDHREKIVVFDVAPIIEAGIDGDDLVDTVQNCTAESWFDLDGIGGRIQYRNSSLFVRQIPRQLEMTEQLLEAMRSVVAGDLEYGSREVRTRHGLRESVVLAYEDITSDSKAEVKTSLFTRVHDVRDLQRHGLFLEPSVVEPLSAYPKELADLYGDPSQSTDFRNGFRYILGEVTSGPWYNIDGFGGTMVYSGAGVLVVRQTEELHHEVEQLLDDTRTALADREPPAPIDVNRIETRWYSIDTRVDSVENVFEAIKAFIAPETWDADNGEAQITVMGGVILVRNSYAVHTQISAFLTEAALWQRPYCF